MTLWSRRLAKDVCPVRPLGLVLDATYVGFLGRDQSLGWQQATGEMMA